ncbi:hypothetical protein [Propionivibrio sp.]|uniref:hypothetical protein n=1 Tax=Propionivibrio sp. TaxID=2212460 RepID=UPI0025CC572E|nr:hypothetical protein [Propionivibrio sp.]MBK7357117.1 hypothetical protein [Propionivibrio sp.]
MPPVQACDDEGFYVGAFTDSEGNRIWFCSPLNLIWRRFTAFVLKRRCPNKFDGRVAIDCAGAINDYLETGDRFQNCLDYRFPSRSNRLLEFFTARERSPTDIPDVRPA